MRRSAKACVGACVLLAGGGHGATASAQETDPPAPFEVSANIGVVSDYRFRGISYSDRKPAIQGGIDVSHETGLFTGTWITTLSDNGGANLEVDLYGGYAGSAAGLTYSGTVFYYVYPGVDGWNYWELQGTVGKTLGPATLQLQVNWVPDQVSYPGDTIYLGAGLDVGVPDTPVSLRAAIGRETGGYDNKWDWELGASYAMGPLTASVSYIDTNYAGINEAGRNARGGVVLSLLASF